VLSAFHFTGTHVGHAFACWLVLINVAVEMSAEISGNIDECGCVTSRPE